MITSSGVATNSVAEKPAVVSIANAHRMDGLQVPVIPITRFQYKFVQRKLNNQRKSAQHVEVRIQMPQGCARTFYAAATRPIAHRKAVAMSASVTMERMENVFLSHPQLVLKWSPMWLMGRRRRQPLA